MVKHAGIVQMVDLRSALRLISRILAPLIAIFLFPRIAGMSVYAAFVLQFYFFIGAVGLLTSPIEHMLIRLRHRRSYDAHFAQLLWAYAIISALTCGAALVVYGIFYYPNDHAGADTAEPILVAMVALIFQIGYFLKFFKRDWFYLYSEALGYGLVALFSLLWVAFFEMHLLAFAVINATAYSALAAIRLRQMSCESALHRLRHRRLLPTLALAYRGTTFSSLIGAFIKRADAFYMPMLSASATAILMYRLVRNVLAVLALVGNMNAQDSWMGMKHINYTLRHVHYWAALAVVLLTILVATAVYSLWLGIPYPMGYEDFLLVAPATGAVVFLALSAVEINRVFQVGRYDIIWVGSLISLMAFLLLGALGIILPIANLNFLLVLCFVPQFLNSIYIKARMHEQK